MSRAAYDRTSLFEDFPPFLLILWDARLQVVLVIRIAAKRLLVQDEARDPLFPVTLAFPRGPVHILSFFPRGETQNTLETFLIRSFRISENVLQ
jgi:hypothetical protein